MWRPGRLRRLREYLSNGLFSFSLCAVRDRRRYWAGTEGRYVDQASQVRNRLFAGGRWIRTLRWREMDSNFRSLSGSRHLRPARSLGGAPPSLASAEPRSAMGQLPRSCICQGASASPQQADGLPPRSTVPSVPQADVYLVRGDSGRTLMAHSAVKSRRSLLGSCFQVGRGQTSIYPKGDQPTRDYHPPSRP